MEMTKRYVALINDDLKIEHAKTSPLKIANEEPKRKRLTKISIKEDEE
jgi:hypothetical protein